MIFRRFSLELRVQMGEFVVEEKQSRFEGKDSSGH